MNSGQNQAAGEAVTSNELESFDLFEGLPSSALQAMASQFKRVRFRLGEQIISLNDTGHEVFFLTSGRVTVVTYNPAGGEVELGRLTAPSYFGEVTAIDGGMRSAGIRALTDCETLTVPGDVFRDLLKAHPDAMMNLLTRFCRMLRDANQNVVLQSSL